MIRLQKYLAQSGVASRRKAEQLIVAGKISVNGKVVRELGTTIDPSKDTVKVGKESIKPVVKGIILFHKPRGVISTMKDPHGRKCIADFLTSRYRSYFTVGRLDWDSSGLMVLTNDGELSERLSHPRYGSERIYEVEVEGFVQNATIRKLERGVTLEDGLAKGAFKVISANEETSTISVTVKEGRNRLVRRMLEHVGHAVVQLRRISHGPFRLGKLKAGELRRFTEREYGFFRDRVMKSTTPKGNTNS